MRWNTTLFRLSASVAMAAMLVETAMPLTAAAQPAPPPLPQAGQPAPGQSQEDPPERVGRVAAITGTVSFHNPGDSQWSPASVNYPVSSGNSFWTDPVARLRLDISDSRIELSGGTQFDVSTLNTNGLDAVAAQGETYLHLRNLRPDEEWSVQTPRGLVRLGGNGRYDIVVGTTADPTLITVVDGSADIQGPGMSLQVGANQTATLTGTDHFEGRIGPVHGDPFLTAMLNAERPPPRVQVPTQIVAEVSAMPGGSDVIDSGDWGEAPGYGPVWYPPVPAGWVPYRQGHWAFIAPWGWTWIDQAPWGFAPFHYGRWIQIGDRWAWTPGTIAVAGPPVYAPALVAFVGLGAGVALGAAIAGGTIGWIPLGPREAYHPWYHASETYMRQVNVRNVTNFSSTNVTVNNFVNRGAATSVPAAAMVGSRPIAAIARPVTPQEFASARPLVGQQPIRPTAETAGVTPGVARQFNLGPLPPRAAGPVLRTQAPAEAERPAAPLPRVTPPNAAVAPRAAEVRPAEPRGAEIAVPHAASRPEAPVAARPEPPVAAMPRVVEPPRVNAARPEAPAAARAEAHGAARPESPAEPMPRVVEPSRVNAPRFEAPRSEPPRPQIARPEPPHPEPARPEPSRAEAPRPASAPHAEARPAPAAHEKRPDER